MGVAIRSKNVIKKILKIGFVAEEFLFKSSFQIPNHLGICKIKFW